MMRWFGGGAHMLGDTVRSDEQRRSALVQDLAFV